MLSNSMLRKQALSLWHLPKVPKIDMVKPILPIFLHLRKEINTNIILWWHCFPETKIFSCSISSIAFIFPKNNNIWWQRMSIMLETKNLFIYWISVSVLIWENNIFWNASSLGLYIVFLCVSVRFNTKLRGAWVS